MMSRLLVIVGFLLTIPAALFAAEPITVALPLLAMQMGQNQLVEAQIACSLEGCSAFDITIEFDPQVIQIESVQIGPFLGEQVFTAENTIDNTAGTVRVAAAALGDPPEDGQSVLLLLDITTLNPGASQLRITHLDVGDMIGNPLQAQGIDGGVVVNSDGSAPVIQANTISESTPIPSSPSQQSLCQYRVGSGDTLSGIALANAVTIDEILTLNELSDPRMIRVGQVLTVPASDCYKALGSGQQMEVFDCRHLGSNVFEWYSARRSFDASGNPLPHVITGGPFTGEWRPGCPAGEAPRRSSGGGGGSDDSNHPGGSGGGGGGEDDEDGGGSPVCPPGGCQAPDDPPLIAN